MAKPITEASENSVISQPNVRITLILHPNFLIHLIHTQMPSSYFILMENVLVGSSGKQTLRQSCKCKIFIGVMLVKNKKKRVVGLIAVEGEGEGSGNWRRASHFRVTLRTLSWPCGELSAKLPVEEPIVGRNGQALVHCCAQSLPGSYQEDHRLSSDAASDPEVLQLETHLTVLLEADKQVFLKGRSDWYTSSAAIGKIFKDCIY